MSTVQLPQKKNKKIKNEGMLFSLKVYKCTGGKAGGSFEMSAALANAFLPLWELFARLSPTPFVP